MQIPLVHHPTDISMLKKVLALTRHKQHQVSETVSVWALQYCTRLWWDEKNMHCWHTGIHQSIYFSHTRSMHYHVLPGWNDYLQIQRQMFWTTNMASFSILQCPLCLMLPSGKQGSSQLQPYWKPYCSVQFKSSVTAMMSCTPWNAHLSSARAEHCLQKQQCTLGMKRWNDGHQISANPGMATASVSYVQTDLHSWTNGKTNLYTINAKWFKWLRKKKYFSALVHLKTAWGSQKWSLLACIYICKTLTTVMSSGW